jgi:phage tail-like protein
VRLTLEGDGTITPRLDSVRFHFPRISLRRYLPTVVGAEPLAADFTDRFLAVFDREFRGIEGQIDGQARLFDPLSAPTGDGEPRRDVLTWLASWIGVTFDPSWPEVRRRRFLKGAGSLLPLRGTLEGLRRHLQLFLGLVPDGLCCTSLPGCGPCRLEAPPRWQPPELILEHYRLRRWLFVGAGRLGEHARLWGERIVNRSRVGEPAGGEGTAQAGVSQLVTSQDPWRDPFHVYAHTFTVFAPARLAASTGARRSLERLIRTERPGHAAYSIAYVKPRFRIGVQSMIGFDSVVGCWPEGASLDVHSRLGRATVLGPGHDGGPAFAVGTESRVGTTTRLT